MYSVNECFLVVIVYLLGVWLTHLCIKYFREVEDDFDFVVSLFFPMTITALIVGECFRLVLKSATTTAKWLKNKKVVKS